MLNHISQVEAAVDKNESAAPLLVSANTNSAPTYCFTNTTADGSVTTPTHASATPKHENTNTSQGQVSQTDEIQRSFEAQKAYQAQAHQDPTFGAPGDTDPDYERYYFDFDFEKVF